VRHRAPPKRGRLAQEKNDASSQSTENGLIDLARNTRVSPTQKPNVMQMQNRKADFDI
jgi:hypothetical protein